MNDTTQVETNEVTKVALTAEEQAKADQAAKDALVATTAEDAPVDPALA